MILGLRAELLFFATLIGQAVVTSCADDLLTTTDAATEPAKSSVVIGNHTILDDVTALAPPPAQPPPPETLLMTYGQYASAMPVLLGVQYAVMPLAIVVTLINIVVFTRRAMRSSTGKYVVGVNVAQLLFLLMAVVTSVLMAEVAQPARMQFYWIYSLYFGLYVWAIIRRGTYWVTCLLTLERLYAIVRPLHARSFVLSRFPVPAITLCYLAAAAFHFYIPAMIYVTQVGVAADGAPLYYYIPTRFYLDHFDLLQSFSTWAKILFEYVPQLLLILFNVLTLVVLRRHTLRRHQMKTTSDEEVEIRRQRQLTVTILSATAAFIILSLPFSLHSLMIIVDPGYNITGPLADPRRKWFFYFMQTFTFVCILLSHFTDFLSFLLLSSAFRRTLLGLLPAACRPRLNGRRAAPAESEGETAVESMSCT